VIEFVTPHKDWCRGKDSQVFWDQESNVSECRECGAITEERETNVETQMMPEAQEESDGHET
jgi:hypothetical protein